MRRPRSICKGRLKDPSRYRPVYADADAVYEREIDVESRKLEPMVACPHEVENTKPIGEVMGTHIDQVFLGSCANAKYEDLVVAAGILKGRHIHPGVRMIITPGSKQIMLEAMNSGVLQTLIESGGMVTNPGCGACAGDGGTLADGEVCLSTANRNFIGRMGSNKSQIYLSSPATLAASAIKGAISDPREFCRIMESVIQGRVFKFGDNINSDIIIPGRYLDLHRSRAAGPACLRNAGRGIPGQAAQLRYSRRGPEFRLRQRAGAGRDGDQGLGIKAVVACSFARTFYRNAINDGLPIVECPELYRGGPGRRRDPDRSRSGQDPARRQGVYVPEDAGFGSQDSGVGRSGGVSEA